MRARNECLLAGYRRSYRRSIAEQSRALGGVLARSVRKDIGTLAHYRFHMGTLSCLVVFHTFLSSATRMKSVRTHGPCPACRRLHQSESSTRKRRRKLLRKSEVFWEDITATPGRPELVPPNTYTLNPFLLIKNMHSNLSRSVRASKQPRI